MGDYRKPLPQPTPETRPFWEGLKQHRLMLQRCKDCHRAYFYPRPFCPRCFSWGVEWFQASGRGVLYSFVINHRPAPGFEGEAPYIIAVVELEEGPRLMSNLVDIEADPDVVKCDMPLEIVYEDVTDDITLPKFRPA